MARILDRESFASSFTSKSSPAPGMLLIQNRPPTRNRACAVFVHGLHGDGLRTWGNFPHLLLHDKTLSHVDFAFYSYATSLLDIIPFARRWDFGAKGKELADELTSLATTHGYDAVVLISHSLGGLVALSAVRSLGSIGNPHRLKTLGCLRAAFFYATPFLGSDRVSRFAALCSPDLRVLSVKDVQRDELVAWIQGNYLGNLLRTGSTYIDMHAIYSATDQWVGVASATRVPMGAEAQWSVSHTKICKPTSPQDRPYTALRAVLLEAFASVADAPQHIELRGAQRLRVADHEAVEGARALYQGRIREDEQDPWDRIVGLLAEAENDPAGWPIYYLVSKQAKDVVALACVQYAPALGIDYGWFTYLASKKGVGARLGIELAWQMVLHIAQAPARPKGLLYEVDDPCQVAADRRQRRERLSRIRLYANNGLLYRVGADNTFSYLQPKLSPTSTWDEVPMFLGFVPIPPTRRLKWITRDELAGMLTSIARLQAQLFDGQPGVDAYRQYLNAWVDRLMAQVTCSCVGVEPLETVIRATEARLGATPVPR